MCFPIKVVTLISIQWNGRKLASKSQQLWVWQARGGRRVGDLGQELMGTWSCCQRKVLYRCRKQGPEMGLPEKCYFIVRVYFTETVDPGCVRVWRTHEGLWERSWCWWQPRNAAEGTLGKLSPGTWPGQALCQPGWGGVPKLEVLNFAPWFLAEFYWESGFSLAGARKNPAAG